MSAMTTLQHLWAVGYDDMERADQVREHISSLGWDKHYLILADIAVLVACNLEIGIGDRV